MIPTTAPRGGQSAPRTQQAARAERERQRRINLREIGEPPSDLKRPTKSQFARGRRDLAYFAERCFPKDFPLEWSEAHKAALRSLERSILEGGTFALAMPRGSGKSTLVRAAAIWAVLYGHRKYVPIVAAEQGLADDMLASIKLDLQGNEVLLGWFPDLLWPIKCADGSWHKARNLTFRGEQQHIEWAASECVLPHQPAQPGSGGVLCSRGIMGSLRGMSRKSLTGETRRPDFVIVDDPQTDGSAGSPSECEKRERIIKRTLLNLSGPRVKIAGVMLCTVIRQGDLADKILDMDRNPEWQGQRTKMLIALPADLQWWEGPYDEARRRGFRDGVGLEYATSLYRQHRKQADAGAVASWPQRYEPGELSAVQSAMNLRLKDPAGFAAEMQQEPIEEGETSILTERGVLSKIGRLDVGVAPADVQKVTAFIDVQQSLLYWAAIGWRDGFSGELLAYGSWPPQPEPYYTYESARITFATKYQGGPDAQLHAALRDLIAQLDRSWAVDDGGMVRTDLLQVDGGWNLRVIREVIRQLERSQSCPLIWGKGVGITAGRKPLNEGHKRKRGEQIGAEWRRTWTTDAPRQKFVLYDSNHWKSFVASRLTTAPGDRGCLMLHAGDHTYHRMLAEQLTSEMSIRTHGLGRDVDEWRLKPGRRDNHLWDCLVGAAVAASQLGLRLDEDLSNERQHRKRLPIPRRRDGASH